MKINIGKHDFSIRWDGVYYKALSNYPNISDWETRSILDFINYEKEHGRDVEIESENEDILSHLNTQIQKNDIYGNVEKPNKIIECTACKHKGCHTDYLCHIASIENAISIFRSGKLLSARNARNIPVEELVKEQRNAANDPADYFEYVMFSWGNCQAGDRLVMERKFNRPPSGEELSVYFTPGIRFYFKYDVLIKHAEATSDGYHASKVKSEVDLKKYVYAIIVPQEYRSVIDNVVPVDMKKKIFYLKNDCKDIWNWTEKVYEFVTRISG